MSESLKDHLFCIFISALKYLIHSKTSKSHVHAQANTSVHLDTWRRIHTRHETHASS